MNSKKLIILFYASSSNRERQENEIIALRSTLEDYEFYCKNFETSNDDEQIKCIFISSCQIQETDLLVHFSYENKQYRELRIQHLPPVRLALQLPKNYPSESQPEFILDCVWLTPWQNSSICQKLDELWTENIFAEILFIWFDFLKNDLLYYLEITTELDVTYLHFLFKHPTDENSLYLIQLSDLRTINHCLLMNPIEILVKNNQAYHDKYFQKNFYDCSICFGQYLGTCCIEINICDHVFCKNCILEYLKQKITFGNVHNVLCPNYDCQIPIEIDQIKKICSPEMFERYEKILSEKSMVKRSVYCPRKNCRAKVITDNIDENLASCSNCGYNFCNFCFKVYHGIIACNMDNEESLHLIEKYQNADLKMKQYYEKKYGRRQIQELVQNKLTREYLKINSKNCPNCHTSTSKVSGCNLMNCSYCNIYFCWICGKETDTIEPYDHFKSNQRNLCSGRLFDTEHYDNII